MKWGVVEPMSTQEEIRQRWLERPRDEQLCIKHDVKAVDRAWTGLYAMMDPCHLLWRGIDLETQARPHAHTRPRADHPSRRGHLMRPRGSNPRTSNERGSLEQNLR